jgi:pyruvate/2-oxoglutarate/acetoin dehydrogenase E1 component
LEKLFLGVPGLRVVAPNALADPAELLEHAILRDDDPVLFIEHKLLYTRPMLEAGKNELVDWEIEPSADEYPTLTLSIPGIEAPHLTIATYGYNFELARAAAHDLMYEHEIFADIVLFSQLSPFELSPLFSSLRRTRRLLTVEEGTLTLGWGAEVAARAAESDIPNLKIRRAAALDLPIGNSKTIEDGVLPSQENIVQLALDLVQ